MLEKGHPKGGLFFGSAEMDSLQNKKNTNPLRLVFFVCRTVKSTD